MNGLDTRDLIIIITLYLHLPSFYTTMAGPIDQSEIDKDLCACLQGPLVFIAVMRISASFLVGDIFMQACESSQSVAYKKGSRCHALTTPVRPDRVSCRS